LFVRAFSADRAFSFSSSSGVTTHVANFSGTIQAGTVTRFDCHAAEIPSGDVVLFATSTERYLGTNQSRLWKALTGTPTGADSNSAQPWFPSAGSLTVQTGDHVPFPGPLPLDAGSRQHVAHHQPAIRSDGDAHINRLNGQGMDRRRGRPGC
jgi:hypothetical protein